MIQLSTTELFSLVLNIILFIWGIWQLVSARKQEENIKGRIRDWQNQAEGIKNALLQISQNPGQFTDKNDMAGAVLSAAQSAVTLEKIFVEERFHTDQEIKQKREAAEKDFKKLLKARN